MNAAIEGSSISRQEGLFLQELIREFNPKNTLEVGLGQGVSALFICEALARTAGTRHIVIDPYQYEPDIFGHNFEGAGIRNLEKAGYTEMVEFYPLPSYTILPKLHAEGRKIDFAFIDGWHTFDYALVDFFHIDKLLNVGGVVCFDDTGFLSVRKACRYIVTNRSYKVYKTCGSDQLSWKRRLLNRFIKLTDAKLGLSGSCIAFRKEAEDKRIWNHHKPF